MIFKKKKLTVLKLLNYIKMCMNEDSIFVFKYGLMMQYIHIFISPNIWGIYPTSDLCFLFLLFPLFRPHHGTASQRVLTTTSWEDKTEKEREKKGMILFNGEQFNEGYFLMGQPVIVLLFSFYMQKRWLFFVTDLLVSLSYVLRFFFASSVVNGNLENCKYRIWICL